MILSFEDKLEKTEKGFRYTVQFSDESERWVFEGSSNDCMKAQSTVQWSLDQYFQKVKKALVCGTIKFVKTV